MQLVLRRWSFASGSFTCERLTLKLNNGSRQISVKYNTQGDPLSIIQVADDVFAVETSAEGEFAI